MARPMSWLATTGLSEIDIERAPNTAPTTVQDVRVKHRRRDVPVSQKLLGDAASGRASPRRCAARDRADATSLAHRAESPVGGAPAADRRGRPPRVPHVPRGHAVIAFIILPSVIDQILTHLRTRASTAALSGARSAPSARRPSVGARAVGDHAEYSTDAD